MSKHEVHAVTSIADMVERMVAAEAPAAAIAVAVRAMEGITSVTRDGGVTARVTAKREGNRIRQQRRRDKLAAEQLLRTEAQANDGATVGATITRDSVTPPCILSSSIKEEGLSSEVSKKKKKEGSENARATRMQPGALLTEPLRQAAIDLGARSEDIPGAWAEFVDFWIGVPGTRGTKLNWPATWRNRVRAILARGKGNSNGRRTIHQAADDLLSKIRAFDEEPPGGIPGGTGEAPVRLLSSG